MKLRVKNMAGNRGQFRQMMAWLAFVLLMWSLLGVTSAAGEPATKQALERISQSSKLADAANALTPFYEGRDTGRFIILLTSPGSAEKTATLDSVEAKSSCRAEAASVLDGFLRSRTSKETGEITRRFNYIPGFAAKLTADQLDALLASDEVEAVQPDRVGKPHLRQGIPLMGAAATRSTYNGEGDAVAVLDTGIDYNNPYLGGGSIPNGKVIGGYDVGMNRTDPMDRDGHGTACAGIVAGELGDTGDYIGGLAYKAKLYAIKITDTDTGGNALESAVIAGLEWCITHQYDDPGHPIMVISISFGFEHHSSIAQCDAANPGYVKTIARVMAAGITVFASAGNEGLCDAICSPACISGVNSVGAVYDARFGIQSPCVEEGSCAVKIANPGDPECPYYVEDTTAADRVAAYSNSASFLTLFAPSDSCYTLQCATKGSWFYPEFGGTSAACPYAAGAAAVLQSAARMETGGYLTPQRVRSLLIATGNRVTDSKAAVTRPRVDVGKALATMEPSLASGDLNADGRADLIGVTTSGAIFYCLDFTTWQQIPGQLKKVAAGDLNADHKADVVGLTAGGHIYYTLNLADWQMIPGNLREIAAGDLNGDGRADLAGIGADGSIFYSLDLTNWHTVPGRLKEVIVADLQGTGRALLVGLSASGAIYYSPDLLNWLSIPGTLHQLTAGDWLRRGKSGLGGTTMDGSILVMDDINSPAWRQIAGNLQQVAAGDFTGTGYYGLAGLSATGEIFYSKFLAGWLQIPGQF